MNSAADEKNSPAMNLDSWSIAIHKKQRKTVITALDYHSGPLILTRDQVIEIARRMGLHVRTRNRKNRHKT